MSGFVSVHFDILFRKFVQLIMLLTIKEYLERCLKAYLERNQRGIGKISSDLEYGMGDHDLQTDFFSAVLFLKMCRLLPILYSCDFCFSY